MPPRKGKAKAKATAAPASPVQAPVPDHVTTKRGKEFGTTAALARPRRESTMPISLAKTPLKRGRPAKPDNSKNQPPKKRGRPAKFTAQDDDSSEEEEPEEEVAEPPKKRGRPPNKLAKATATKKRGRQAKDSAAEVEDEDEENAELPKKRGRSAKDPVSDAPEVRDEEDEAEEMADMTAQEPVSTPAKRGRGRPPKASKKRTPAPAVPEDETPPPKKRGSSPHGGETTKIDGDDDAAAEQLEDELMQDGDAEPIAADAPAKKGKGKAKMAEADVPADASSGKQYWLMKAEQEDREEAAKSGRLVNTKFTIDDLRSKSTPEMWDGVRNPTAAKNMRGMKQGDLAFFYASGGKQGRKPGIVGIMEIVKEAEPDPTTADEDSIGYVEKEKDRGKWVVVHVEFRKKLTKPVFLSELQKFKLDGGALSNMQELIAARLSVSKVSEKEWNFITKNLIEGYEEDEEALPGAEGANAAGKGNGIEEHTNDDVISTETTKIIESTTTVTHKQTHEDTHEEANGNLVSAADLPEMALPTIENDMATSDSAIPAGTSQTSRPASRASSTKVKAGGSRASSVVNGKAAGSRASSAAKGNRSSSRAGSAAPSASGLAPPTTKSRGRSITPRSRAGSARPAEEASAMQTIGEE